MQFQVNQRKKALANSSTFSDLWISRRGCCEVADGKYEITLYTSCCNVTKGIYYYNTYENHQISAVDMHKTNLDQDTLVCYPVLQGENIHFQN